MRFSAVTVLGLDGPHVTPVAAVEAAGHWWFTTSRAAAKLCMLRRDPRISITRSGEGGTRVISGRATILDPTDPAGLLEHLDLGLRSGRAVAQLALEHFRDVTGYVADRGRVPDAWSPTHRVLVVVAADRDVVLPVPRSGLRCDVIGLADADGPFAVPGTFDGHTVTVEHAVLLRTPDWALGIAAMLEGDPASRPTEQSGLLVRGAAAAVADRDRVIEIDLAARSMVRWTGFDTWARRFEHADV